MDNETGRHEAETSAPDNEAAMLLLGLFEHQETFAPPRQPGGGPSTGTNVGHVDDNVHSTDQTSMSGRSFCREFTIKA